MALIHTGENNEAVTSNCQRLSIVHSCSVSIISHIKRILKARVNNLSSLFSQRSDRNTQSAQANTLTDKFTLLGSTILSKIRQSTQTTFSTDRRFTRGLTQASTATVHTRATQTDKTFASNHLNRWARFWTGKMRLVKHASQQQQKGFHAATESSVQPAHPHRRYSRMVAMYTQSCSKSDDTFSTIMHDTRR